MKITRQFLMGLSMAVASLVVSTGAEARSLMPSVWDAELTHHNIDRQLPWADAVTGGHVELNYAKQQVRLTIFRRFYCPPGMFCAQVMPAPIFVTLPIVGRRVSECGSREVLARLDRRPVDGTLEVLTVTDNTTNRCPTFAPLASTEVVYGTRSAGRGRLVETRSTFSGDRLRPVYGRAE